MPRGEPIRLQTPLSGGFPCAEQRIIAGKNPLRHGLHCPFIGVMLVYDKQVTASGSNERQSE